MKIILHLMFIVFVSSGICVLPQNTTFTEKPLNNKNVSGVDSITINVNNLWLPVNKYGVLADVGSNIATYDGKGVIFSGGFFLSGISGSDMWVNAVASASRVQDYQPGPVDSNPSNPINSLYVVRSTDAPFSQSWLDWADAVQIGASYYDGDGNGIYNPVDLNGNGIWDLNEDRPDLLGDMTAFTVINDGVDPALRRFNDMVPQGIEIQQTVFAWGFGLTGAIKDAIFIRYRIINTGTVAQQMDSVYFSVWADPDLGDYTDDLVGSDTLLQSGFAYNDGPDAEFGINPPSVFFTLLQGPPVYISGVTFEDLNGNGVYDEGIDIPLDSAYSFNGLYLGTEVYPGATNLDIQTFINYMSSHPTMGDPSTALIARYYMLGYQNNGTAVDPCTYPFGTVYNVNCGAVNPHFLFSGDPVTNNGWIQTFPADQRAMVNTGPFKLQENKPIDIIAAYIVGRSSDHLSSIPKARENVQYAFNFYNTNFSNTAVNVEEPGLIQSDYHLYQNYPNPFNPSTKIRYSIPETGKVRIAVYDVLGREIKTLVNDINQAGSHEISFNASDLPSGIYFYTITAGNYINTKKMILVK